MIPNYRFRRLIIHSLIVFVIVLITIAVCFFFHPFTSGNRNHEDLLSSSTTNPLTIPAVPSSKILKVGFSFAKAPYVIPNQSDTVDPYSPNHARLGFEIDIFQLALTRAGYRFCPYFESYARNNAELSNGNLDAAELFGTPHGGVYYSQAIAHLQNFAFTKAELNYSIQSIADLKALHLAAWQHASIDLGPEFTAMAKGNPDYVEKPNQPSMFQMFAVNKIDAMIADKFIFEWWHSKSGNSEKITSHSIFPGVNSYYIGFHDITIRDAFNREFVMMLINGEVDSIIHTYLHDQILDPRVPNMPISVTFGSNKPPFVMDKEQRGICIDLAFEAFRRMHIVVVPAFASYQRIQSELSSRSTQIAVELQKFSPDFFYSEPFMTYHNVVATRVKDHILFRAWSDLRHRRVNAWQMAESNLGKDFGDAVKTYAQYSEFPNQREQVYQWASGNADAIVIDKTILLWQLSKFAQEFPEQKFPTESEINIQALPQDPALDWYVGFQSSALRDRFNHALQEMRKDGAYERIFAQYGAKP